MLVPGVLASAVQGHDVEINSVQMHRLPLEDVIASAWVVWCCFDCEYEPVVLMLKTIKNVAEDSFRIPYMEHLFHENVNFWHVLVALRNHFSLNKNPMCRNSLVDVGISGL
jgi:hypothetical protein